LSAVQATRGRNHSVERGRPSEFGGYALHQFSVLGDDPLDDPGGGERLALVRIARNARHDEIGQSVDADAAPWKDVIDRR